MIVMRPMTLAELGTVLDWAAAEGWNPGFDDAPAFFAADPDGFFVALEEDLPVAAISVVNHGPDFAFLGLYLCRPGHRGQGIGYALWRHALAHAGDRTVGLDGVPDQQDNYARSGFVRAGSTSRYSGRVSPSDDGTVRSARAEDVEAMIALETASSGWAKPAYLATWFAPTEARRTFVLEGDDGVAGLTTVRRCRSGAKIGPLIARDEEGALALIRHAASVFGDSLVLDVPASAASLDGLCRRLELEPGFSTARMYRGAARSVSAQFYAVASLELG